MQRQLRSGRSNSRSSGRHSRGHGGVSGSFSGYRGRKRSARTPQSAALDGRNGGDVSESDSEVVSLQTPPQCHLPRYLDTPSSSSSTPAPEYSAHGPGDLTPEPTPRRRRATPSSNRRQFPQLRIIRDAAGRSARKSESRF